MKINARTNSRKLGQSLKRFAKYTKADARDALNGHARLACRYLANYTQPYGLKAKSRSVGERRVQYDIEKVYYTHQSPFLLDRVTWTAIRWYEQNNPDSPSDKISAFKRRFEAYQSSNSIEAIGRIVTDMKFKKVLFDEFDAGYHQRSRDPKTGRVEGKRVERVLVLGASGELWNYTKKMMDRVGLSKAAWATAATQIPFSNRITGVTADFPGWVKRHVGRAKGSAKSLNQGQHKFGQQMTNEFEWITPNILPDSMAQKALNEAQANYIAYMETAILHHLNKQYEKQS